MLGTSKSRFSQERYCKKYLVMEIVFNELWGRILSFFKSIGDRLSGFLGLGNRVENKRIFGAVTDPESGIWRGGSGTDLGIQNR